MMLNLVKVQKVKVVRTSIMEEKEITKVEIKEIIKEDEVTISTKKETTTSYHTIREEVKIILVLSIECNNHMCVENDLFSIFDEAVKSIVKFRNNINIPILGKGQVPIKLKDGSQISSLTFYILLVFITIY
ncbi:hypothetical protein CR513_34239, partial [Mucuna pruriens]